MYKTFLLLIMFFVFAGANAQSENYKSFYVVARVGTTIEPTSRAIKNDQSLNLTFAKASIQNLFNTKSVYVYEKAFPTAITPFLQRTYILKTDDTVSEADLKNAFLENVEYVKELGSRIALQIYQYVAESCG